MKRVKFSCRQEHHSSVVSVPVRGNGRETMTISNKLERTRKSGFRPREGKWS